MKKYPKESKINLSFAGHEYSGQIVRNTYQNSGAPCLVFNGETEYDRIATLSTNIGATGGPNLVAIKDYSENQGLLDQLQDQQIVGPTIRMERSGFVQIPIVEILVDELREDEETDDEDLGEPEELIDGDGRPSGTFI